jgi:hypothetical protein
LCGFCKCSHLDEYAALSKTPHALADGLMLVFKHPGKGSVPTRFSQGKNVIPHMNTPHASHAKVSFDFRLAPKI